MKKLLMLIMLTFFTSTIAIADQPPGKGLGNKSDIINKADTPPGLSGKATPPGLSKKDKTPPGWSKGEKRGWDNDKSYWDRTWDRFIHWFRD